jgi:hypothetical protein
MSHFITLNEIYEHTAVGIYVHVPVTSVCGANSIAISIFYFGRARQEGPPGPPPTETHGEN